MKFKNHSLVWILSVALAGCLMGQPVAAGTGPGGKDLSTFNPSANFTLTDQNGETFELKDVRGKLVLLFFGYLSCPDVCPLTLSRVSRVYSQLSEAEREQVITVFVSVDTERDTVEKIREYLNYFKVNGIGLTGTQEDVDSVVKSYKAWYEKVRTESALGYLIDHTSYIYLIGADGLVKDLFWPDDDVRFMVKTIRKQLKGK